MRLHDLEVSAFGPFAGTVRVDFDELNDAGLFLMTGATGAGKSSLLDAVCFALYGTVPGARGVKTLKSQHASADAKPEVVLDFTVQGRRFVVRRTPEWTRPKRRGTGMLTEKASATILEKTGGAERLLSARAAEVGLTVSGLMGMNAGQFVQVALLPQGEFQTFLRATSQERHDVLQQLFRTDRFARIEDWVGDHSRRLVTEADSGRCTVQRILDTVADRAGVALPEPISGDGLASAAAEGRVLPWVEGVLGAAVEDARVAQDGHDRAQLASRDARQRHDAAQRHVEERRRRDAARQALAALEASEPAAVSAREALAAHDRATRCRPFLDLRDRAAAALDEAVARRDRAVRALTSARPEIAPPVPGELSADGLSTLLDTVRSRVARLEALVPRQQAAESAARERDMDLERLVAAERDLHEVGVRAELLPAEIEARSVTSGEAAAASAHRHELAVALDGARARYDAAVRLAEGGPELRALDDARRDARDRVQDAREHLQSLVARRLAGMAAELAGALVDGAPCQVCGSTEHPHRGTPAVDAVTDADHRRADQLLLAAASAHDAAEQAFRELQRRHDALRETASGTSPGQATAEVVALARQLAEARAARDEHARLEEELVALRAELAAVGRRQAAAAALVAGLRTSVAAHDRTLATVTAEVAEALGDELGQSSLREAVLGLTAWCDVLAESRRALDDLTAAHTRLSEATTQALGAASEHGFGSLAEVAGALVADGVRTRTEAQLRDRADTQARVRAVLDDPDAPTDEDDPPTDPDALRREAARADQDAAVAARRLALHEDRVLSLTRSLDRLTDAMDAWAPIRDEALRAEAISRLVRGMGHDNQLQMRLSAYVLATRLDQVVAAANERLGHLRDQRYLLQRTGRAERRSSQAGLGLEVVDQWTGDVRAPATLSGGETFVVSLSLALGLADVVTHESGGTEIETLFVDEGFGTLDADTLDDVMDRLDGLRAGGRTVGVVSHVTELRNRIPTQVHVEKGRAGSTVTVRTLVG